MHIKQLYRFNSSDVQHKHCLSVTISSLIHCVTEVSGALPSVMVMSWRSKILIGSSSSNLHSVIFGFFQKACSSSILIALKNENSVCCYKQKYITGVLIFPF